MAKNNTGQNIKASNASWNFDKNVWKTFDTHINKSIPLYEWSHKIGLELSDFFLSRKSSYIDLGCSTGTFINKLNKRHLNKNLRIFAYDSVKNMIKASKLNNKKSKNIKYFTNDITKSNLPKKTDLITSFYTLSFIKPSERQKLFNKIYNCLNWGGAIIFFDKVRAPDARFQDMMSQVYINYKIDRDFTPEEILNKSNSIKGVLEPFSTKENYLFLKRSGFKDYMTIFKYVSFEGFIAIK
tara:strand:- start:512 stop:1231 length:720 start_codon:yes stop_codon:yes gene_type:complete